MADRGWRAAVAGAECGESDIVSWDPGDNLPAIAIANHIRNRVIGQLIYFVAKNAIATDRQAPDHV